MTDHSRESALRQMKENRGWQWPLGGALADEYAQAERATVMKRGTLEWLRVWGVRNRALREMLRALIEEAWDNGNNHVGRIAEATGLTRTEIYEELRLLAIPRQWARVQPVGRVHNPLVDKPPATAIILNEFRVDLVDVDSMDDPWRDAFACGTTELRLVHQVCGKERRLVGGSNLAEVLKECALHLEVDTCEQPGRRPCGREEVFAVRRGERLI